LVARNSFRTRLAGSHEMPPKLIKYEIRCFRI
jgi:hypothetical protein